MSLILDDDLHEILRSLANGRMTEVATHTTILKLVLDMQKLRKVLQVTQALEPGTGPYRDRDFEKAQGSGANQAAVNPRAVIDTYVKAYPELKIYHNDLMFDGTKKEPGGSDAGS